MPRFITRQEKQIGFIPAPLRIAEASVFLLGRPYGQKTRRFFTSATDIDSKKFKEQ
jgi:hypothetical protein